MTPYEQARAEVEGMLRLLDGANEFRAGRDLPPLETSSLPIKPDTLRALLSPPEPTEPVASGIAAHLPSAEWLSRTVATDPDVDCEASPVPTEPTEEEVAWREHVAEAIYQLEHVMSLTVKSEEAYQHNIALALASLKAIQEPS